MRKLITLALLVWAVPVVAGPGSRQFQQASTVNVLVAHFPFQTPGCYPTGSVLGTRGVATAITVSRTGTRTCNVAALGAAPQLVTCQANEACVEAAGLLVEPARTNLAIRSDDLAGYPAVWVGTGSITRTADQAAAPDGTLTADKIAIGSVAISNDVYQRFTGLTQNTTYTWSIWVWTDAGTKSFRLARTNTLSWGSAAVSATFTATTTPQRFSLTYTTATGETSSDCLIGSEQKTPFSQDMGNYFYWGAQHEASAYPTSYIATVAASATRNADSVSITNPLVATNPAIWCVEGTYTPESGRAWTTHDALLWGFNSTTDSARAYAQSSTGSVRLRLQDSSAASYIDSTAAAFAAGSTHRVAATGPGGSLALRFDGALAASTPGGSAIGSIAAGYTAPMYLGSYSGGAEFGGYIQNFKVSRGVCR